MSPTSSHLAVSRPLSIGLFETIQASTCAHCTKPANQWCGGCLLVAYCSKECQEKHWSVHERECPAMEKLATAVTDTSELSECPICFCDMNGKAVKLPCCCSAVFCRDCLQKVRKAGTTGCPLCRERLPPAPEVLFQCAFKCHHRSEVTGDERLTEWLPSRAVQLYEAAMVQGHVQAQVNLALCYYEGTGVQRDYSVAADLWEEPAMKGHVTACVNLGVCYYDGLGRDRDCGRAVKFWHVAAKHGDAGAQCNLGVSYSQGKGVAQNYEKAAELFAAASIQGHADAQHNFALCYDEGEGVEQDHSLAVHWYEEAAAQGHVLSQLNLGVCFEKGLGAPVDFERAAELYSASAAQGNTQAPINLKNLLRRGKKKARSPLCCGC